jgi:hypothetical protein
MTEFHCTATVNLITYEYQTLAAVTTSQAFSQFDMWLFDNHQAVIEMATRLNFKRVLISY